MTNYEWFISIHKKTVGIFLPEIYFYKRFVFMNSLPYVQFIVNTVKLYMLQIISMDEEHVQIIDYIYNLYVVSINKTNNI